MIVAVRTTTGREAAVVESLVIRVKSRLMKEPDAADEVKIKVGAFKEKEGIVKEIDSDTEELKIEVKDSGQMITLEKKDVEVVKKAKQPIKAILQTEDLRGYIFIEADDEDKILELVKGAPHIRGLVGKEVSIDQLERFIVPEKQTIKIEPGDIIEVISGPFKGERAKVQRIDEVKQELSIELLEAAIPIAVTIPMAAVRLYEKKKENS